MLDMISHILLIIPRTNPILPNVPKSAAMMNVAELILIIVILANANFLNCLKVFIFLSQPLQE
jgi:hypothetical protein